MNNEQRNLEQEVTGGESSHSQSSTPVTAGATSTPVQYSRDNNRDPGDEHR